MSEVKTYAVNCNAAWLNTDGDDVSGSYVKYADYKALATRLDIAERACAAMAAENALIKSAIPEPLDIEVDNDNMDDVSLAEDFGFNHAIELVRRRIPETPATDAFLDEVRASAIPEGYTLVPQQIFLEPSDIESICSQCGDGHESGYGDFTGGLLWIGDIQCDDGSIVHGLHISSADYSEGGVTVCEFSAELRKGGEQK